MEQPKRQHDNAQHSTEHKSNEQHPTAQYHPVRHSVFVRWPLRQRLPTTGKDCRECFVFSISRKLFMQHVQMHAIWSCKTCRLPFDHLVDMQAHFVTGSCPNLNKLVCSQMHCGHTSDTLEQLAKHQARHHTGKCALSCKYCGRWFDDEDIRGNHESIHEEVISRHEEMHPCVYPECAPNVFMNKDDWHEHNYLDHVEAFSADYHRDHVEHHIEASALPPRLYRCPQSNCKRKLNNRKNLDEHLEWHNRHNEPEFTFLTRGYVRCQIQGCGTVLLVHHRDEHLQNTHPPHFRKRTQTVLHVPPNAPIDVFPSIGMDVSIANFCKLCMTEIGRDGQNPHDPWTNDVQAVMEKHRQHYHHYAIYENVYHCRFCYEPFIGAEPIRQHYKHHKGSNYRGTPNHCIMMTLNSGNLPKKCLIEPSVQGHANMTWAMVYHVSVCHVQYLQHEQDAEVVSKKLRCKLCAMHFTREHDLSDHLHKHINSHGRYPCPFGCQVAWMDQEAWFRHVGRKHAIPHDLKALKSEPERGTFACNKEPKMCQKCFRSKAELLEHENDITHDRYSCSWLGFELFSLDSVVRPKYCDFSAPDIHDLLRHKIRENHWIVSLDEKKLQKAHELCQAPTWDSIKLPKSTTYGPHDLRVEQSMREDDV